MSINFMNTQCYQCNKNTKNGRFYLSDNGGVLSIPIKDWKNMRCLYNYLLKTHKLHDRSYIKNIVQTAMKSNGGVFLLDNDEDDEEPVKKAC